jgi:hypothetical protein
MKKWIIIFVTLIASTAFAESSDLNARAQTQQINQLFEQIQDLTSRIEVLESFHSGIPDPSNPYFLMLMDALNIASRVEDIFNQSGLLYIPPNINISYNAPNQQNEFGINFSSQAMEAVWYSSPIGFLSDTPAGNGTGRFLYVQAYTGEKALLILESYALGNFVWKWGAEWIYFDPQYLPDPWW